MADNYSTHTGTGLFPGRATRSKYWLMVIMLTMLAMFLFFISFAIASSSPGDLLILWLICGGIVIILGLPVTVRRYHDLNMSGWWLLGFILLGMLPFVGFIASIVNFILLGFIPGTRGRNNYGPDPLSPEPEEEETPQPPRTQTHVSSVDIKTCLEDLKTLLDTGVISYEEYSAQRERILKDIYERILKDI